MSLLIFLKSRSKSVVADVSGFTPTLKDTKHWHSAPFIWPLWTDVSIEVWSHPKRFYNGVQLWVSVCVLDVVCLCNLSSSKIMLTLIIFTRGGLMQNKTGETKKPAHGLIMRASLKFLFVFFDCCERKYSASTAKSLRYGAGEARRYLKMR